MAIPGITTEQPVPAKLPEVTKARDSLNPVNINFLISAVRFFVARFFEDQINLGNLKASAGDLKTEIEYLKLSQFSRQHGTVSV